MPLDEHRQVPLRTFYEMALHRQGLNSRELVEEWQPEIRECIVARMTQALANAAFVGGEIPNFAFLPSGQQRTNQSKGNVAAKAVGTAINSGAAGVTASPVLGAGYPDKALSIQDSDFICCFEIKATSDWNDQDGNRRVKTSAPAKLIAAIDRGQLPNPPCHLLGTVLYDAQTSVALGLRLDFLEPGSLVNVRLEASTSHLLLVQGIYHSVHLGSGPIKSLARTAIH